MNDSLLNRMDPRQFFSCILLVEILTGLVNGKVSMTPTNVEVLAGDRFVLKCTSTDKQPVIWRHLPTAAATLRDVYVNGTMSGPYSDRLTVEKDEASGAYSLTAFPLNVEDSGRYFCREEHGNGDDEKVAEIVVLASRPRCRTPVVPSQRDCQATSRRSLRIDCSVEFSGNVRPLIECRNIERGILEREGSSSNEISDSRVVLYSFISKVDFGMNKQTILCKTSLSHIPGNTMEIQIPSCESGSVPMGDRGGVGAPAAGQPSSPVNRTPLPNSRKVVIIVVCVVLGFVAVVCIGIAFACTYRMLLKSSDGSPAIRFLWKLPTEHPIVQGVTLLNGCLYVVHRGKKSVSVYEASSPCKYLGTIILEGLLLPQDIASCAKNSCLYVTDSGIGCVWKVEVQPKMENRDVKISAWVAKVGDPHTISVISGGRVLMAQKPNILRIYRSDGTIFRSFEVKGNIREPQHAVRTPKGTFVISHGSKFDSEHRVCEVSAKGEILRQFGNRRGERDSLSTDASPTMTLRLSHPRHLAIDSSGRVLLSDRKNNRIIRLDKTLAMIETFPCPGADNTPVRLSCDIGRFLIGRGDAVYFYRIVDDDEDEDGKRRKDSSTKKNEDEDDDDDSDYYTDDVIAPKREARERRLLSNLVPLRTHSSASESSRLLRQRNLKQPRY